MFTQNKPLQQIQSDMAYCSALFKTTLAAPNNAAIAVMLEAHDHLKTLPCYRREVKRAFRKAIEEMRAYRRHLIHDNQNRFFHVKDMPPDIRRRYGDITDEQYYEMWEGSGDIAYDKTHHLVTALHNKYKLSHERNAIAYPDTNAWACVALSTLAIAVYVYEKTVNAAVRDYHIPRDLVIHVFGKFSLQRVIDAWKRAIYAAEPELALKGPVDEVDDRNISDGIHQLLDQWTDTDFVFDNVIQGVEEYAEVFASKRQKREAMLAIAKVKHDTPKHLRASR